MKCCALSVLAMRGNEPSGSAGPTDSHAHHCEAAETLPSTEAGTGEATGPSAARCALCQSARSRPACVCVWGGKGGGGGGEGRDEGRERAGGEKRRFGRSGAEGAPPPGHLERRRIQPASRTDAAPTRGTGQDLPPPPSRIAAAAAAAGRLWCTARSATEREHVEQPARVGRGCGLW